MINLYDILNAANGQLFGEAAAQIFTDFCFDAQNAAPNTLFVTHSDARGDTHRFIEEAIKNGASGIVCQRPPTVDTSGVSVLLVKDSVDALLAWARHTLKHSRTRVIAAAGSSGNSTAVQAISRVLASRHRVHSPILNLYDERLSVPVAVAQLTPEHDYLVLRLGAEHPGELQELADVVSPEMVVISAAHHANLDNFNSIDHYVAELRSLAHSVPASGYLILNYDDDRVRSLAQNAAAKVLTMGVNTFGADIMAFNVVEGPDGTGFDLRIGTERIIGRWIPLLGRLQAYGVLAALLVAQQVHIPVHEALEHLKDLIPLPRRMQPLIGRGDSILIDDTHSATPESAIAALEWLNSVKDPERQRVFFVLGDLDHLGTYSHAGHRSVGKQAAEVVDVFITEGADSAAAARAAQDYGLDPRHIHTTYATQDTLRILTERYTLGADDLVLVKGGRLMGMDRITTQLSKEKTTGPSTQGPAMTPLDGAGSGLRPSWVEIDTNALVNNLRLLRAHVGQSVGMMAVVKADAYGHGALGVSKVALINGASYLAVANVEEALILRDAGIDAPILLLSYTPIHAVRQVVRNNLTATVYDLEMGRALDRAAHQLGVKMRVHVKVDTGLGRLGVLPRDAVHLFRHLKALHQLEVEGIYTHFSAADEDPEFTRQQLEVFNQVLRPLQAAGFKFRYIHASNSPAVLAMPEANFNMVRVGLAMYGLHPSQAVSLPDAYQPVMGWKTVVAQVKTLPAGHHIGYGNTYTTTGSERVAVIPVGYADGFRRSPHWGEVLIHGQRVPIRGRVSMEKTVVSVDHIPDVTIGDEVVLLGTQGGQRISAEEIAQRLGTINYEVVCSVLPRVPRK